jgi:hypothetical protein
MRRDVELPTLQTSLNLRTTLQIPNSLFPIPCSLVPYSLFPIPCSLVP